MHAPAGARVELRLTSADVIHALYVPALRIKLDAVPDRETTVEFVAPGSGKFDVLCAEYCGERHSQHVTRMLVEPDDAFRKWLGDLPPPAARQPATRPGYNPTP